jgi:hypothetical protein
MVPGVSLVSLMSSGPLVSTGHDPDTVVTTGSRFRSVPLAFGGVIIRVVPAGHLPLAVCGVLGGGEIDFPC